MIKPVMLISNGRDPDGLDLYTVRLQGPQGEEAHGLSVHQIGMASEPAESDSFIASLGADCTEFLLRAVKNFQRAQLAMFYPPGSIRVVPPFTMPKRLKPVMLNYEGMEQDEENRHLFRVVYEHAEGPASHVFTVDNSGMIGISWESAFFDDLGGTTELGAPLLNCIMDFFEAGHPMPQQAPLD